MKYSIERKVAYLSFLISISVVFLMLLVFLYDKTFHLKLYTFGVYPRKLTGLVGVLTSPFIHNTSDWGHFLNNSYPIFVLTWLLFYSYRTIAFQSFIWIYFMTGVFVWIFGRESYHIGMSGVIYGLTSFLILSGFFRKNLKVAGVSLLVVFLYGSIIWGVFPQDPGVSWEGHFFGFLSGLIMAVVFKKNGPQSPKYNYEIEEELGLEPENEYWKEEKEEDKPKENPLTIHYTYKPKKKED